ncbi:MAG TPA: peroxiredoxin [Candidatus Kapabacteria bacterium]|nr:peroxiredoxin [Candidatus Kapabacteria bacterium]
MSSETAVASTVNLKPGDTAPDFSAESTDGSRISLDQFKNKSNVILYFYPEDMTSGCTIEAQKFRDDRDKFKAANTAILGVSLDDRAKHEAFTKKDNLNFPLLADVDSRICNAYGVPVNPANRHPARWTFLIGKDGKIKQTYRSVDPKTHSEQLLRDIANVR